MESLNYIQVVTSPTFISGSLLDHVYVKLSSVNVTVNVINVYYSDHDAIQVAVQNIKTVRTGINNNYILSHLMKLICVNVSHTDLLII